ncbi:hypothetical protein QPK87_11505 [Kamptonema cortianum]|nr:hypothetical protein [Oscillatoria laete-virens]MDK3157200.1 hypothetical protein [Kamptonema cortianum]MDL5054450.1 hypothetical protein [Oscillatoria laete-virens NRMC-F 0139]
MKKILRLFLTVTFLALPAFLTGCSSSAPEEKQNVSSIPWNRPQKWEGGGALGGMMGGGSR